MKPYTIRFAWVLLFAGALWAWPSAGWARISLEALQRDGYGMVELKRPQPNVLTVTATVNGRSARLIVDTGWSREGITVDSEYGKALRSPTESVMDFGRAGSGKELAGIRKGVADIVSLGNVQMRQVPTFFGTIGSLQHAHIRRTVNADGFIGSGFLRTCSGIIDLHNLRLYLRPPGTGRRAMIGPALKAAGLAEVPFAIDQNRCLIDVEVNGAAGKMVVDTGATVAGVDARFAPQMKVVGYSSRIGSIDAAGVTAATTLTNLRSFKIAGVGARAPDMRMGKFAFYQATGGKVIGLLGMDIMGANGTIIDFGQQKLYFYPLQ